MAKLYFKVGSDVDKVIQLRQEIAKLKQELMSMDVNKAPAAAKALQTQIGAATQEFNKLTTEAAKAGAVMENDFKSKIYQGSQAVNDFTQKIINQKAVVKDVEADVRRLGESYRSALKRNPLSASSKLSEYTSAKKVLDEEKAALFGLTQEQANARLSVKKLRDEYSLYKDDGKGVVNTTDGIGVSLKKAFAVIGGVAVIKQLGSEIIRVRGEFQSMQTAIETLVGKDMAGNLIPQIKELAKVSPLTLSDMVGAEKMMLGFNIKAEDTIRYLQALGDISMGNSQKFNSLTLAFSQTSAAGKLMGQDLNQMINAGFNPLQQIAQTTGKSIAQLKDEMSKGAISAEMVQKAFVDATSAGGKFFGMSENTSKTINGQISMMQDAMDEALNEMGQKSEGVIMSGIQMTTKLVENYETVGKILSGLIITYGAYRTAVMLVTAAHSLQAAGISTLTAKEAIHYGWLVATKKAQMALNASMLANPYVLLATVVVGLGAAMWAMSDNTNAAARAQKEYNEIKGAATQKEKEHKQKIEELLSVARDESLATLTRQKSLEELRKEYPKIFEKYDIEKLKLTDILELKRQINEEDSNRSVKSRKEDYGSLKETTGNQQRYLQLFDNPDLRKNMSEKDKSIWKMFAGNQSYVHVREDMEKNASKLKLLQKDVLEDNLSSYKAKLKDYSKEKLETELNMVQSAASKRNGFNVGGIMVKGGELDNIVSSINGALAEKKSPSTYDKDYNKAKKDWEDAKKKLAEIEKDKSKFTSKQYEEAKKLKESTEKSYKDLGGVTGSSLTKQENQAEKLRQEQEKLNLLLNKQALEQSRSEQDLQNQVDQARIDSMKEGSTKTLAQMQLNHKKEMQQFEREKEDKLRKAIEDARTIFDAEEDAKKSKNPKYTKKTFDASGVKLSSSDTQKYGEQKMYLNLKQSGETQSLLDKDRQAWNEYLAEYGSFQEKKQAITAQYNEKIADASTEGEKASLKKELEGKQKDLNLEEIKSSINFADIFGNLDAQSTEALSIMRDKLKEVINKSANDLKPTDLKALQDAFTDIDLKISERNPFGELKQGIDDYKESTKSVIKAQEDLNTVQQGGEVIVGLYTDATGKVCKKLLTQEQAERNLSDAQRDRRESQIKLTESVNSIGEKGQQLVTAGSDITDMLTSLGVSIPESISGALDGIGQVMDSMASIDITKPMSIITGITGTLAGIGKAIGSIFGGSSDGTKVYEDMKEQLSAINEIYEKIIENSKEEIVFGGGFASVEAANNALDTYYKKVENYRRLADAAGGAGASVGSHSYAYRTNENLSGDWGNISRLIGKNISGIQDMYSLTGEQLYLIQTKMPDAWNKISSEIKNNLNAIIDCKDEAGELADALNAAMTGVDTDSFYNGFIDSLSDMDTSFEDMCDNFEGYLRKSIIAGLVASQYQGRIDSLYKKWSDAAVSDKKITEEESKALQDEYKGIVDDMMKDREDMANSFGWESSESSSQNSTKGMSQSMSQDTGDELNGRFTAFQISNEEIKNQNILQSQSLNLLTFKADAILSVNTEARNIADETRTILANSYLELVQISENTGESAKYLKDIKSDIAEVKRNTSRI